MASQADIARLREANDRVSALVRRDLERFWQTLDLARPEAARDALLGYVPALVTEYGDVAATISADWYDEMRAEAGVRGRFSAIPAGAPEAAIVQAEVRYAAGALWTDAPADALDILTGSATRYVLQAGRDTITGSSKRDPQSYGWTRISSGGCDWCDMLAGRGAVYRRDTADFAAHDHCRCGAAPSWDPSAPEVSVQQYEATERKANARPAPSTDIDATRTTEQLRSTLESLQRSAATFETPGTAARIADLQQKIAARES